MIHVGLFLPQNVSLMGLNSAVDTMRLANRHSLEPLYRWTTLSLDGTPITASNGLQIVPDAGIGPNQTFDRLFVCGGVSMRSYRVPKVLQWLRAQAFTGTTLGGITTGAYTLAHAGLLDGYRCSLHWEDLDAFKEDFPQIDAGTTLFTLDRDRWTTAGGIVTVDLFLHLAAQDASPRLAEDMARALHLDRVRTLTDDQPFAAPGGRVVQDHRLRNVTAEMAQNLSEPLSISVLAEKAGLSPRALHRLFVREFETSPIAYYLNLRLARARWLLRFTSKSLAQIAAETGYGSQSSLTTQYRLHFDTTPLRDRNMG